jgi:hypothetical protein
MWDESASKFLFEIGDVVEHKSTTTTRKAVQLVIVARALMETQTGIQRSYELRGMCADAITGEMRYISGCAAECELVPLPPTRVAS